MLRYATGRTLAHRLDPRSKLALQFGVAIAATTHRTPLWVIGLTLLGLGTLWAGRVSLRAVVRNYRIVLVVLALGPVIAGVALGPPWFRVERAVDSLWSVGSVLPVLLVSAMYVRTTPIRETRTAIQWFVPGRVGQLLAVGVSLVFRLVPQLRRDVSNIRAAMAVRLGGERSIVDQARRLGVRGLQQSFLRADRLSLALRARCFSYNPTLPELRFSRADGPVLALSLALTLSAFV